MDAIDPSELVPDSISGRLFQERLDRQDRAARMPVKAQNGGGAAGKPPNVLPEVVAAASEPETLDILRAKHSLAHYASLYISSEVYGIQAENTLTAKIRDLGGFIRWFVELNGHGEIKDWMPRDTMAYLHNVEGQGKAPATINRIFASLRHFARWVHEQPGAIFATHGLPTRGVKELVIEEPDCKKLSKVEIHRLFRAADALCMTQTRSMQRPRRNRAIFAILYTTGLRVSELLALERRQYDGKYLRDVKRKGRGRTRGLYLIAETRAFLDEYLTTERLSDDPQGVFSPLFVADKSGQPMKRQRVREGLMKMGQEAGKHSGAPIPVHPHRLRHTFGSEYRERSGSDTETASALGHASLKYVGRYVRKTDTEREHLLENTFSSVINANK